MVFVPMLVCNPGMETAAKDLEKHRSVGSWGGKGGAFLYRIMQTLAKRLVTFCG